MLLRKLLSKVRPGVFEMHNKVLTGLICTWRVWHVTGCNHAKSVMIVICDSFISAFRPLVLRWAHRSGLYPTISSTMESREALVFSLLLLFNICLRLFLSEILLWSTNLPQIYKKEYIVFSQIISTFTHSRSPHTILVSLMEFVFV